MSELKALADNDCIPCKGGIDPMDLATAREFLGRLGGDWQLVDGHHLYKEFSFPNFLTALEFTNRVGAIAETEGHHPDLGLGWGYVNAKVFTHSISGLHESDFFLAAKLERAFTGA